MAITISFEADASQVGQAAGQAKTSLSTAFAGIMQQLKAMEQATQQSTTHMVTAMTQVAQQGTSQLVTAIGQVTQAIDMQSKQFDRLIRQYQQAGQASKPLEQSQKGLTTQFDALTSAVVAFVAAFQATGLLGGFLKEVTLTAARTETLGVVLQQVSKNAGITALEAGTARDRIKELGVTTQEASSITARFIQANLGLENAIKLANVARNAAVVADQNTSQALSGLVQGILTLQQETLRTYGIFVNLSQANEQFAKANGRTVESLSVYEKQQIALNAVLEQGVALNGTYEAALGTVGKQVTSLTRITEESQNVLGNNYLPIFGRLVKVATALLVAFQALPQPVQTAIASILGAATAVGTLTIAVAALVRVGQVLAVTSLFTGWGAVILAIGAATAGVIALSKALGGVGQTDPATVLKQSLTAIDSRIASTQNLLSAQESSLAVMQKQLEQTPESKAGAEIIARQTARVEELRKALQALQVVREQVGKPVPLPPPKPEAPVEPPQRPGTAEADVAARARALVTLQQQEIRLEAAKLDQIQAMRGQALEQDRDDAINASTQTKSELDQIERAFAIRRLDLTRLSAQEDLALQVKAAAQARDTKLAALDAEAVAAQASSGRSVEAAEASSKKLAAIDIQRQTVRVDYAADLVEITKKGAEAEAAYIKGITALERAERAEQIRIVEQQAQRTAELQQQVLQSQAAQLDAEKSLVQAQVDGLVLTKEEGLAKTQALEVAALDNRRAQLDQAYTEELRRLQGLVDANQATEEQITNLKTKHQGEVQALNIQQQTLEQTHRNELLEGWRDWVRDVQSSLSGVLVDVFEGEVDSIKDVFDSLKSYFFKLIADMIAYAATNAIIVPIVGSVLGGFGGGGAGGLLSAVGLGASLIGGGAGATGGAGGTGGGGGGLMGTGSTLLTGAGLARTMYQYLGIDSLLGSVKTGFSALQETFLAGLDSFFGTSLSAAQQAADMAALIAGEEAIGGLGTGSTAGVGGVGGSALGIAGGLAALGFGIYSALNASNIAAQAAFAASAAAGAAAAVSAAAVEGLLGAAAATGAGTGWTGIGAIVAAAMAVIGVILDRVIKPSGPTLSVGVGEGEREDAWMDRLPDWLRPNRPPPDPLRIGVEGGQLVTQGRLATSVRRREGLDPAFAEDVRQQMEEGITAAVKSIVQTINAVALDPAKLLEPTQAALRDALASIKDLNSSNIEKMSTDISEQLRFINIQVVAGMLDPVNKAFDQLRDDSNLKQQIERLPGTTAGLVAIFKTMNEQLEEIGKGESSDVLRQLSAVRNQVENFGNRIAGTAGQISEAIVNGIVKSFEDAEIDISLAKQITQFAELMNQSLGALSSLRATQQTLEGAGLPGGGVGAQIDRLTKAMGEQAARLSTELVSTALGDLATQVDTIITQPLQVQATTVNALFTDSMAALNTLWAQWHALADAGIDTTLMQEQFNRLVTGVLETTRTVIDQAFAEGSFSEFLAVLAGIPKAVTDLNPEFAKFRMIAEAFAPVVNIAAQGILTFEDALRSTAEKVVFSTGRIADLRSAIADAGDSADKALPLYAQLAQAIISTANLQIQQIQEIAQAWHQAMDQTRSDIDRLEETLGTYRAPATAPAPPAPEMAPEPPPGVGYRLPGEPPPVDYSAPGHPGVGYRIPTPGPPAIQPPMPPPAAIDESAKAMTRLVAAVIDLRVKATDFQTAVMSGDVEGAIKAIHAYEQAIVKWADTAIKEIEKERQAYIDAQQAVIDGIQRQIEAQEGVIDAINDQIDAQQDVIDAIHDQMDAQQDVIDGVQDQINAQQDLMDATREAISAQQEVVNLLQEEADARQKTVDSIKREIEALKQLRDRIGDITREEAVPAAAAGAIRALMAATREHLGTVSGDEAIKDLEKLVSLNQELLNLGEESSQLILIQEALNNLAMLQQELNDRLAGKEDELSVAEQQLETAKAALTVGEDQLKALEAVLAGQEEVVKGLQDQLEFQQDVLKGLNDQLEVQEAVLKDLNDQLEVQQKVLEGLQDELEVQQKILENIEKSTYWDNKIAEIQTIALNELYNIEKWLAGIQGPTTWEDQIKKIQEDAVAQLKQIELDLKALFLKTVDSTGAAVMGAEYQRQTAFWSERMSQYNLALPVKVTVGNFNEAPRQQGGIVGYPSGLHYAQGGMVPTLLEPGERVLMGPMSHAQQGAAMAWNQAWPRFAGGGFTVPGSGSGDTVPMMLPQGSFVLNRNAARAMGHQGGGMVNGNGGKTEVHNYHYSFPNLTIRSHQDLEELKRALRELERQGLRRRPQP